MGILYLVSTPIGNMEDITLRAIKTLFRVDHIACEDTRRTGTLIRNLEIRLRNKEIWIKDVDIGHKHQFISYYDEVEFKRIPEIMGLLDSGQDIALVSDAGTPLISDPGFKLVRECLKRSIKVEAIPGPSSVITALCLSGLPPNYFRFIGYLPVKSNKRRELFNDILSEIRVSHSNQTIIAFETSHRLEQSLNDLQYTFGDLEIVISRELTKIHERVYQGRISVLLSEVSSLKGEIVVLFNIPQT